ncbi:MAG: class I lanthipeptide [Hyphomicrobiales bacterium]
MKKLNFKKETVAQLNSHQLNDVVGGRTYTDTCNSCGCPASEECETLANCGITYDAWCTYNKCVYLDTLSMCGNNIIK